MDGYTTPPTYEINPIPMALAMVDHVNQVLAQADRPGGPVPDYISNKMPKGPHSEYHLRWLDGTL